MTKTNVFTRVSEYINKVAEVEARYEAKAEEKHEELMELETAIAEKKKSFEAVHKMYVLDDITEQPYLLAKAVIS